MDTPPQPGRLTVKKWQISQDLDRYEDAMIERKKHTL